MNLAQFERRRYTTGKTPIEYLKNLTQALGGPKIYMKRDDMLGLAAGGNKTRKLEFLMADAIRQGADTILTCGALQSNHARLTLAAAAKEGLKCRLILEEAIPGTYDADASGNFYLFQLLGVEKIHLVPTGRDAGEVMEEVAELLRAEGRKPYIVPMGGSNAIGTLGYVACAEEILEQSFDMGVNFSAAICPTGSGGTHAGLVTGFVGNNAGIRVLGMSVSRKTDYQTNNVLRLCGLAQEKLHLRAGVTPEDVTVYDAFVGGGYTVPTAAMAEAVRLLARTESILLDPVYSGKAMSGLIHLVRSGAFSKEENILFVHTGGVPVLYTYRKETLEM